MSWLAIIISFIFGILFVLLFLAIGQFVQKIVIDIARLERRIGQLEVDFKRRNDVMTTGRFR